MQNEMCGVPSAPEPSQCALPLMSSALGFGKMRSVNLIYFLAKGRRQLTSLQSLTKVGFLSGKRRRESGFSQYASRPAARILSEPLCSAHLDTHRGLWGPESIPLRGMETQPGSSRSSRGPGWGLIPSFCSLGLLPPGCSLPILCPLLESPTLMFVRGAHRGNVGARGLLQGP